MSEMTKTEGKGEFRRKLHSQIVFFGMVINFLVIGAIFYFVLTRDPNMEPPANSKYSRYFNSGGHESGPGK